MTEDFDMTDIEVGDALLYKPSPISAGFTSWFFGQLISIKTWNRISHVEIYAGSGKSYASRDGKGISLYDFRRNGLAYALRPVKPLNIANAQEFFAKVDGEGYDWRGLLCFTLAVHQGAQDKMFCSEFATRWYRAAGLPIFGTYDSDKISPAQFLMTEDLTQVWPIEDNL